MLVGGGFGVGQDGGPRIGRRCANCGAEPGLQIGHVVRWLRLDRGGGRLVLAGVLAGRHLYPRWVYAFRMAGCRIDPVAGRGIVAGGRPGAIGNVELARRQGLSRT